MKKDKIIFFNSIEGLSETYPIIYAKDYKPKWIDDLRKDYISKTKNKTQDSRLLHLYRYPGSEEEWQYRKDAGKKIAWIK